MISARTRSSSISCRTLTPSCEPGRCNRCPQPRPHDDSSVSGCIVRSCVLMQSQPCAGDGYRYDGRDWGGEWEWGGVEEEEAINSDVPSAPPARREPKPLQGRGPAGTRTVGQGGMVRVGAGRSEYLRPGPWVSSAKPAAERPRDCRTSYDQRPAPLIG